jgi:amino acid transporter
VLSFVLTAVTCGLCALCYAEIASMVPVAGSAYTYAYVALGEVFAWIIGWDLIIEYAVGNIYVAQSWAELPALVPERRVRRRLPGLDGHRRADRRRAIRPCARSRPCCTRRSASGTWASTCRRP